MISFDSYRHRFNLRAAAIILRGDAVLLHRLEGDTFWSLPGGRIEAGEHASQAVVRELREELSEAVDCGELIWVVENFFEYAGRAYHEVGLYFLARLAAGSRLLTQDGPFIGREGDRPLAFEWFECQRLAELDLRPSFVAAALMAGELRFQHVVHHDEPSSASTSDPVELRSWFDLSAEQQSAARELSVSAQQLEFAGATEAAVAQCEAGDADELVGVAVLVESSVAGLLLLKRGTKAPAWAPAGAVVISAMRIDARHQGQGFGTAALRQLPAWVARRWPSAASVVLSVDEENTSAIKSYLKAGWMDNGTRVAGRIGWVRHMTRPLAAGERVQSTDSQPTHVEP